MQKLERLLNLTAVLLHTGRPLTIGELRERLAGYPDSDVAFRRAFERDKDDLRELGIPIDLISIPGSDPPTEGYRIPRNEYYLPDPGLDQDELAALHLAATAVQLDDAAGVEAMWKLGGDAGGVHSLPLSASLPADPNLSALFDAVSTRSAIEFVYRGAPRRLYPYRLGFQIGRWYLRGFDLDRDDMRVFRVDRIDGGVVVTASHAFEIPEDERNASEILPDRWELGSDPPVVARLWVDPSHAPFALGQFDPGDVVSHGADGSVEVEVTVSNHAAFRSLVLSYLDHAVVLSPPELRAEIVTWLGDVAGASLAEGSS